MLRDRKVLLKVVLGALLVVLLAGCAGMPAFTPERAALQQVLGNSLTHDKINPNTLAVLQTQNYQEYVMVLVAFQEMDRSGQLSDCLFMYEIRKMSLGWVPGSGGGSCGPAGEPSNGPDAPISVAGGNASSTQGPSYTEVRGMVYHPEVTQIEVTWEDGETQQVDVVNSSYLAIRDGSQHRDTMVKALNASGEVLYTHERAEPAPGKQ